MEDVDGERGTYMSKRVSWKGVSWGAWSMKVASASSGASGDNPRGSSVKEDHWNGAGRAAPRAVTTKRRLDSEAKRTSRALALDSDDPK